MTPTTEQMIAWLSDHLERELFSDTQETMLTAIKSLLMEQDTMTLPELPDGYYLYSISNASPLPEFKEFRAEIHETGKYTIVYIGHGSTPRAAALAAIAKIGKPPCS